MPVGQLVFRAGPDAGGARGDGVSHLLDDRSQRVELRRAEYGLA